jgi:hypothetical protein
MWRRYQAKGNFRHVSCLIHSINDGVDKDQNQSIGAVGKNDLKNEWHL